MNPAASAAVVPPRPISPRPEVSSRTGISEDMFPRNLEQPTSPKRSNSRGHLALRDPSPPAREPVPVSSPKESRPLREYMEPSKQLSNDIGKEIHESEEDDVFPRKQVTKESRKTSRPKTESAMPVAEEKTDMSTAPQPAKEVEKPSDASGSKGASKAAKANKDETNTGISVGSGRSKKDFAAADEGFPSQLKSGAQVGSGRSKKDFAAADKAFPAQLKSGVSVGSGKSKKDFAAADEAFPVQMKSVSSLDKAKAAMLAGGGGSGGSGKLRAASASGSGGKGSSASCPFAALHAAMGGDASSAGACPVAGAGAEKSVSMLKSVTKGADVTEHQVGSVVGSKKFGLAGTFRDGSVSLQSTNPSQLCARGMNQ
jgi:hypothetical protein